MKIGRNDACPYGSGKKYKQCHWGKEEFAIPKDTDFLPSMDDLDELDPAKANVMSPEYWETMSQRLPSGIRKKFGPTLAQVKLYAEMESRREQIEAIAKFLAKHPELKAMGQAQCEASEDAALQLLLRDDARRILLSPKEVRPWFDVLEQRLSNESEVCAILSQKNQPDEASTNAFMDLTYDVASEMAKSVFNGITTTTLGSIHAPNDSK